MRAQRHRPRWRRGLFPRTGTARSRSWSSRFLHQLGELSAHAGAGLVVAAGVLAWVVVGAVIDFPAWWENALYITSSLITLVMVFAIQHTQARQQSATQRKLDELLRAAPAADDHLIAVEDAPDDELEALAALNAADRARAEGEPPPHPTPDPEDPRGTAGDQQSARP